MLKKILLPFGHKGKVAKCRPKRSEGFCLFLHMQKLFFTFFLIPLIFKEQSDVFGFEAEPQKPEYLKIEVSSHGDSLYRESIAPVWVFGERKGKEWRKFYRLVYNFNKVYPYALMAKRLEHRADSTIRALDLQGRKRERFVNEMQRELWRDFDKAIRDMTIGQGALLIRLVDREIGVSGYSLIRNYKSGIAAGFWQGVAKIFSNDLKSRYDPAGIDKETEELVSMWEKGEFPFLYYSIFAEYPELTEIPSKYR